MSSKIQGADPATPDEKKQFELRGDLAILKSGDQSDCVIICRDRRVAAHKAFFASRSGWFRQRLNGNNPRPDDKTGKHVIEVTSHAPTDIEVVLEFIYGAGMIGQVENPAAHELYTLMCVELYSLGLDFDVSNMAGYMTNHLGEHLSQMLKEICVFPYSRAREAFRQDEFSQELGCGIFLADQIRQSWDDRDLPYKMLVDFTVAGREVILRDRQLHREIGDDSVPTSFVNEALLAQYQTGCQTKWMTNLLKKPDTFGQRRYKCAVCKASKGMSSCEGAHYNRGRRSRSSTHRCAAPVAPRTRTTRMRMGLFSWSVFKKQAR